MASSRVLCCPVETVVEVEPRPQAGGGAVQLTVSTPTGVHVVFLSPDSAELIAVELAKAAPFARAGLHVAGPVELPPSNGKAP